MFLLCDSGSTKTDWLVGKKSSHIPHKRFQTSGINPALMGLPTVENILIDELLPQIQLYEITEIEFYGAGCIPDICLDMEVLFSKVITGLKNIKVSSDLYGAAKALCGNSEGIAAILGTGSNSCFYNGNEILKNTPALGYILGDEGSGAVLGRNLLNSILKRLLPTDIIDNFYLETGLKQKDIVDKVYRGNSPNRFLASFSTFIHNHIESDEIKEIVISNFQNFLVRNILQYGRPDLPVNCVGSIAYYYSNELKVAAEREGFKVGKILKSPLEGLFYSCIL